MQTLQCVPCVCSHTCFWLQPPDSQRKLKIQTLLTDPLQPGLFYKTPLSLIPSFINSLSNSLILFLQIFKTPSLPNHMSQEPEVLRESAPPSMCHMSRVTCHMSCVTCHVSHVACIFCLFCFYKLVELLGGGSVINGDIIDANKYVEKKGDKYNFTPIYPSLGQVPWMCHEMQCTVPRFCARQLFWLFRRLE